MKYSINNGKSLGTILTFAIAGAAIGVMLVPLRKTKVRERIIVGAQDLADFIKDRLKEKSDDLISITENVLGKSKTNFNQWTHEVKDNWEKGKDKASDQGLKL